MKLKSNARNFNSDEILITQYFSFLFNKSWEYTEFSFSALKGSKVVGMGSVLKAVRAKLNGIPQKSTFQIIPKNVTKSIFFVDHSDTLAPRRVEWMNFKKKKALAKIDIRRGS